MCRRHPQVLVTGTLSATLILAVAILGCSQSATEGFRVKSSAPTASTPPTPPPAPPAASQPSTPPTEPQRRPVATPPGIARPEDVTSDFSSPPPSQSSGGMTPPPPTSPQALPAATQGEYVRADVGVGQKGRTLERGFITTPVQVYFRSREHVAFRIQVPQALQFFQAEHGRLPESHEEFWREIIEKNNIQLPSLPPGHKYVYVPEKGELMVEVPAGSPPP